MQNKNEQPLSLKRVILTSFLVDILDLLTSVIVAWLSGSVVMLTQALEGLTDLVSSGVLVLGLRRSLRKEDRMHPFGYGREIYFWTLISALVMLGSSAVLSIYFGYQRFIHPHAIEDMPYALGVLLITIFTNGYAFMLSYKRLVKHRPARNIIQIFYLSSLVEIKTTFILDLMGTCASFLGIVALGLYVITGDSRYDGLGAMIIGTMLIAFGILLIEGIRDLLVGRSAPAHIEAKIKEGALKVPEVDDVLGIKTVHMGSERLLVALDVHMKSNLRTRELEELMDEIKDEVRAAVPSVKYIQVELETRER